MIDGLLFDVDLPEDREEPPAAVSPDPPADGEPISAAALSQQLSALSIDTSPPAAAADAAGDAAVPWEEPGPETVPARPPSPEERCGAVSGSAHVPLVGGDARRCGFGERTDPGGAGDGDGGQTPPAAGRGTVTDEPVKALNGADGVAQVGGEGVCKVQSGAEGVHKEGELVRIEAPSNGPTDGADPAAVDCDRTEEGRGVSGAVVPGDGGQAEADTNGPVAEPAGSRTDLPQNGETPAEEPCEADTAEPPSAAEPAPAGDGECTAGGDGLQSDRPDRAEGDGNSPLQLTKCEWLSRALTTLAPRYQAAAGECSLLTCLNQYTAPELLAGNNKFGCDNCTELRNKRLPPPEKGRCWGGTASGQVRPAVGHCNIA